MIYDWFKRGRRKVVNLGPAEVTADIARQNYAVQLDAAMRHIAPLILHAADHGLFEVTYLNDLPTSLVRELSRYLESLGYTTAVDRGDLHISWQPKTPEVVADVQSHT